MEISVKEMI